MKKRQNLNCRFLAGIVVIAALAGAAYATENGATVFPVGVETVLTGMQPPPGHTEFYEFSCFYGANEFDNSRGKSSIPEFKLRVLATAVKATHNWGFRFLGGTVDSQIAIPLIYQQLHVPPGKFSKYSIGNVDLIPVSVTNNRGAFHWYYEADLFTPGSGYSAGDVLNVGQHNTAIAPVAGFTFLPQQGKVEISSRYTYILNGYDKATHYHSGNEFMWEYNVDRQVTRKMALGFNGYFYKQTTDDFQNGAIFADGFRGRDLAVGPQVRFPLTKHGGFAVKYYRDTLVQNKPRGNALWFQLAVPVGISHDHDVNR